MLANRKIMGDMADDLINQIEQGQSLVLIVETGEKIVVDNIDLIYLNIYTEPKYKVLGDYYEDEDC